MKWQEVTSEDIGREIAKSFGWDTMIPTSVIDIIDSVRNRSNEKIMLEGLRDRLAMAALTGMLAQPTNYTMPKADRARQAYEYADEMLKARKR